MADKKAVASMSREDLEAESERLRKEKAAIREQQNEVDGRLDAFRELDRLNIPADRLQELARVAQLRATGTESSEKK